MAGLLNYRVEQGAEGFNALFQTGSLGDLFLPPFVVAFFVLANRVEIIFAGIKTSL